MALDQLLRDGARSGFETWQSLRHHLHAHPELSYQEHETAAFVAHTLTGWGLTPQTGVAGTGIVVDVQGQEPGSSLRFLRADLDALPIHEANDVPYKSTVPGVMHACGHDVHTTCLLGAIKLLQDTRAHWTGTVRCLFQPGEEKLPGGASLLIAEGVLDAPGAQGITGQHVFPELPAGKVGFREGQYMASCDELHVTVTGKGGHGAMPHKNIDPVLIASHLVVAMQQIVSRGANPEVPSVLSFGRFMAEGATNVIPNEVRLEGTFRTLDETWRAEAHKRMVQLAEQLVSSMGGTVDFRIDKGYPSLFNDPAFTRTQRVKAETFLGADNVVTLDRRMTAEDFAYYTHHMPGCFYRLGTASPTGDLFTRPVHHPSFNIDEQALITGVGLMAYLAAHS